MISNEGTKGFSYETGGFAWGDFVPSVELDGIFTVVGYDELKDPNLVKEVLGAIRPFSLTLENYSLEFVLLDFFLWL